MNILFIYSLDDINTPERPLASPTQMQSGISYVSAMLKKHGHTTKLLVLSRLTPELNAKRIDDHIRDFDPAVAAFMAVATEYPFIKKTAELIKKDHPKIFLLIGGPHASLVPETVISGPFDGLCIGEGEYPALELVTRLGQGGSLSDIKNLWIKAGPVIHKNHTRPLIEDLDSLPFPDRGMWDPWLQSSPESEYPILIGRGCPYSCTYCCNHALRKLASGPYVRFRSPDNIIQELKSLPEGFKNIYLEVETIGANKAWLLELTGKLEELNKTKKAPFTFRTNLRVSRSIDLDAIFDAFKRANIMAVNIGLESGSARVRQEILKRDYSNEDIIKAAKAARERGISIHFYNLIGVPGETLGDFKETVKLNRLCQPEKAYAHIFYPYPGTELYETCKKNGLLPEKAATELERCQAILDLPGFTRSQIQKSFILFDYYVYRGHRPLGALLGKTFVSWMRSNPVTHRLYRRASFSPIVGDLKKALKRSLFKRI